MSVGLFVRGVGVLACVMPLASCGLFAEKPPLVEFPVPRTVPFDVWSAGPAPSALSDGGQAPLLNPFDPIALNNIAVAEAARGRYQQALTLLQRAVKLAPARADIAANLASMRQWLAQAEGQAALGLQPQRLQLPYQESAVAPVPPLWRSTAPLPAEAGRQDRAPTQNPGGTPSAVYPLALPAR
jgi:hypothetical protein